MPILITLAVVALLIGHTVPFSLHHSMPITSKCRMSSSSKDNNKNTRLPSAVLYDVDGTISDSFLLGFSATDAVLRREGFPAISEETYHKGTMYTTPRRFAWHATNNPDDTSGIGDRLGVMFDDNYVKLVSKETAPLYFGIDKMLRGHAQDYPNVQQGALSNACGAYVRAVCKANELEVLFRVMKGADEVPEAKPKGGGLLHCSSLLGVNPSECIYVGDAPTDGQAAKAAGYRCAIGVTWGSHPAHTVRPAFDHTVGSVKELDTLLRQLLAGDSLV
jgi:phosphoglycolate phosphatase-like HAD superfamily hydrolase